MGGRLWFMSPFSCRLQSPALSLQEPDGLACGHGAVLLPWRGSHGCILVAGEPGSAKCLALTLGKWDLKNVGSYRNAGRMGRSFGWVDTSYKYPLKFSCWLPSSINFQTITTNFCLTIQLSQLQTKYAQHLLQEREPQVSHPSSKPEISERCVFLLWFIHSPYYFPYWLNDEANYCQHTLNKKPKNLVNI